MIIKRKAGYFVLSKKIRKNLDGSYKTREEALKRLRQIEFVKHFKGSKGQTVIILILLVGLIIGVGTYFARQYFVQGTKPSSVPSSPSLSPPASSSSTFQELLTKNCKNKDQYHNVGGTITLEELPVKIEANILREISKGAESVSLSCQSVGTPYTWYISIENASINLYDEHSKELGHGGYSYFRMPESQEIIKKTNDITIAIWLNSGEGPPEVSNTWIVAEGIKRFTFGNGQFFYADFGDIAIDFDDPRLIVLLKQYAEPLEGSDYLQITKPDVEQAIIKQFFSNLEQVNTPEKEMIASIERVLNGISLK